MSSLSPDHNLPAYSVSEISSALKRVVEDNFGYVRVRGEISGFKRHGSGHCYFSLKDDGAVLASVCWKGMASRMKFAPEDGLEVLAYGRVTTYPGQSKYQLVVETLEPAGAGALMALLEKRKAQLTAEGLFDAARKQPLPFLPKVIGVVTSSSGAVIRDILHRLEDRFPVHVLVWPVAVQGEGAAEQIARAIAGFNALPQQHIARPDLLIVARGGGSLEDLWPFNEEIVVRAAALSEIPLISAVGHETDTTLIDFAADRRAPTPTAAAEMAVPVRAELLLAMAERQQRLNRALYRGIELSQAQLQGLLRALPHPRRLLEAATQRLDDAAERLPRGLTSLLRARERELAAYRPRLRPEALLRELHHAGQRLAAAAAHLRRQPEIFLRARVSSLAALSRLLDTMDYQRVLARGYALVRNSSGRLITHAGAARPGALMAIEFHDGGIPVRIESAYAGALSFDDVPPPAKKTPLHSLAQPTLFDKDKE